MTAVESPMGCESILGVPANTLDESIEAELRPLMSAAQAPPDPKVPSTTDHLLSALRTVRSPTLQKWFWPDANPFCVGLSHDVDEVRWSWRRRMLMAARHPATMFEGNLRYWNFERILDLERRHGVRSSWFFVADGSHPRDPPYHLEDVREAIRLVIRVGNEVGLHGSFLSYNDSGRMQREREAICSAVGDSVPGVRQHFLNFDPARTWKIQESAGFTYDSTLAFNEVSGFRTGMCHPYYPPGHRILEIPLVLMDGQLFWYEHLSVSEAISNSERLANEVIRRHGLLTLNWHQHTYDAYSFPGWWAVYEHMLRWLTERRALFLSYGEIAKWWAQRDAVSIRSQRESGLGRTWAIQSTEPVRGLTLRALGVPASEFGADVPHHVVSLAGESMLVLDELRPNVPVVVTVGW